MSLPSYRHISAKPKAIATLLLLLYAFHNMRSDLFIAWGSEEYGHGIIIPVIALLMGWHRLTRHPQKPIPSWWGASVLFFSGACLFIAELAAFQPAAHYGFILALLGVSLSFLGTSATRLLLPAFIYLFFAIPLPHLIYANLSQDLQLLSSTIGVKLLELAGISVYQEGNIIDLGLYKLQVAEACSGLRYLFPLISFGYLAAYIMRDAKWKRATVFLSAIPITIGMNSLRIALIGVTVNLWGPEMAEGFLHQFEGWAVFTVCVILLLAEAAWLMRGTGHFRFEIFGLAHGRMLKSPMRCGGPVWAALCIAIALASSFGTGAVAERSITIPPHPPFALFPAMLGDWRATEQGIPPDVLASLQLSDYWLADYHQSGEAAPINLYIAYYDSQRIGSSTHSPSNCIPGGGWQVADKSILPITLPEGQTVYVTRMLIRRADVAQLVYFWFSERGRNITETSYAKWYMLVDSIGLGRTDGALIRMVTPLNAGEDETTADTRLQAFLALAQPSLDTFIPGRDATNAIESPMP